MTRPLLLDLFCGAGGAAMGYHRAGFDVIGVDIEPHPDYPFPMVVADAMAPPFRLERFDAIHASPPCQAFTNMSNRWRGNGGAADQHPDLVAPTRALLVASGCPYVIENVAGARVALRDPFILHGGMFGLGVHRPRLFESNHLVVVPKARRAVGVIGVYGEKPDGRRLKTKSPIRAASSMDEARAAMGIDWMTNWRDLAESIPPIYTEHIGRQLLDHLGRAVA